MFLPSVIVWHETEDGPNAETQEDREAGIASEDEQTQGNQQVVRCLVSCHIRVEERHARIVEGAHGQKDSNPPWIQTVSSSRLGPVERDVGPASNSTYQLPKEEVEGDQPGQPLHGSILAATEFLPFFLGQTMELRIASNEARGRREVAVSGGSRWRPECQVVVVRDSIR